LAEYAQYLESYSFSIIIATSKEIGSETNTSACVFQPNITNPLNFQQMKKVIPHIQIL
jgi:hypothetical protein